MSSAPLAPVPLDVFKRPDHIDRWKWRLVVLATVAAALWWLGTRILGTTAQPIYSPGRVAHAHAMWDNRCSACHADLSPISSDHWVHKLGGNTAIPSDSLCQSCHAGPAHHANTLDESTPSCAACHRDHRGPDASLVHLPDEACVRCHGNLAAHAKDPTKLTFATSIKGFTEKEHPEFSHLRKNANGALPKDPGRLRFDHRLHMSPGLSVPGTRHANLNWGLAQISETHRHRYQTVKEPGGKELVQLECNSCHQPEGASPASPRGRGERMSPILYEQHCAGCHPLTFDPESSEQAPHGKQPSELHTFLERFYTTQLLKKPGSKLVERMLPDVALPGRVLGPELRELGKHLEVKLRSAEKLLYLERRTCGVCHSYDKPPSPLPLLPEKVTELTVETTRVPRIWHQHARFDHRAHRTVDCRECHAAAFALEADNKARNSAASNDHADILLPGMATCLQCHGPARTENGLHKGGARFHCTECHNYHHGDKPLQGRGAKERDAGHKRTIRELLSDPFP